MVGSARRVRGGAEAKAYGAAFESLFEKMCNLNGVAVTRIPDSCKRVYDKQTRRTKLIQIKSPWDWVITYGGNTALIDTKTTQGETFTASMCVDHQIDELAAHNRLGGITGYVVWLRKFNLVYFLKTPLLLHLRNQGGSIEPRLDARAVLLGNYSFDVKPIFGIFGG